MLYICKKIMNVKTKSRTPEPGLIREERETKERKERERKERERKERKVQSTIYIFRWRKSKRMSKMFRFRHPSALLCSKQAVCGWKKTKTVKGRGFCAPFIAQQHIWTTSVLLPVGCVFCKTAVSTEAAAGGYWSVSSLCLRVSVKLNPRADWCTYMHMIYCCTHELRMYDAPVYTGIEVISSPENRNRYMGWERWITATTTYEHINYYCCI